MAVTPEEVRRVAALARLDLDPGEVQGLTEDLNRILDHVDALEAGDAEDPDFSARGPAPGVRGAALDVDAPGSDPLTRPPKAFAPEFREGHFTVPRLESHDEDSGGGPEGDP